MVLFGVLAVVAYRDNTTTQANLKVTTAKAAAVAAANQKAADTVANQKANELPYYTYAADSVNGGFQLQFPKGWSSYAQSGDAGVTLNVLAQPGTVVANNRTGSINSYPFRVQLTDKATLAVNKDYAELIKKKKVTQKPYAVSGIQGNWYEGAIDDKRHVGVIVVIPLRDKTMIFETDSKTYLSEFQQILSTAKITP